MSLLPLKDLEPSAFYSSGLKLKPDFALIELNRLLDFVRELNTEVRL